MDDRFEYMIDAIQKFYLLDKLEDYKDDPNYNYFCKMIFDIYNEIIAIDTIEEVDKDE